MHEITMQQLFGASPDRVFEAMTDHVAFGRWMNADISVERPGEPAPNGLGAVRVVRARGTTVREEVVRWEPPRLMAYRVIGGAPLRNHLGEIRVTPQDAGARVDYRIRFEWPWFLGGALVGRLIAGMLRREITAGLAKMAAAVG
jgi:uncharacterized protein YndB with AHSA1/START domain